MELFWISFSRPSPSEPITGQEKPCWVWEGGTARLLSLAGGGRTFPWHSAPSWGDSGDVLWKITGAVFEAQGGVWWHFCHCWGWRCCSDKGKQEFLKWWLSQRGFVGVYFNTGTPRIVGCVLALCSSSLAGGNGSRVTERGRGESQGAQHSSVCAVLCCAGTAATSPL